MQAPDDASDLPDEIARQLAEYRQALDLPELDVGLDVAVWFHTGQSHRASGQIESAVACFKKVIELAPGDAFAYWELVDLYVEQGVPPAAVMVLSALGEQLSGGQEWIGAIAAWERASELAPDDADVLKALRDAYAGAGNHHEAGRVESALETLRPTAPTAAKAPASKPAAPPAPEPAQNAAPPASPAAPARPAPTRRTPPPAEPKTPPPGPQPAKKPAPASFDKSGRDARGNGPGRPGSAAPSPGSHAAERGKNWPRETRLGEICLSHGWVTEEQMRRANEIQRQSNARMGRILVEMDAISEQQLSQALAEQWRLRYIDLADTVVDSEVARLIPSYLARRHGVVAIGREGNRLVVAMSDPSNVVAIDDIRLLTGLEVEVVIASAADIAKAQGLVYGGGGDMEEMFRAESEPEEPRQDETNLEHLRTAVEEAPIIRAVNDILSKAILAGASDIHIEPHRHDVKVRLRIDGVMQDIMSPPKVVQAPLISRLKILADMDIAERRLPQDGHIHLKAEGKEYDLRVSTLPTVLGEKMVLRILDQSSTKVALHELGFAGSLLETWEGLITKPYGMILVTGPTGSGKTTTLYTSLARINTPERNIVSVENPVEYQIPRVNQVQVNVKVGLTFASGLRTILRQDPDVVLIGEIRDRETAEIAVQASMTGHLVLSTIHTNDAPSAVVRLRDMGVEPFLITSSLIGVLAQRLLRVTCSKCKEAYVPPVDALRRLGLEHDSAADVRLYRGKGCDHCRKTGYKGRLGVFELMVITDPIRGLAVSGAPTEKLRELAIAEGMRTLRQDAVSKVLEGVTTFEEMLRVVFVTESV